MAKTCPNCGAPIKRFQSECEYCGNEIEGNKDRSQDKYLPIVPYGGKISAEIELQRSLVQGFSEEGLERFCREMILGEMLEEVLQHIDIKRCVDSTDFCKDTFRVRGTLILGDFPKESFYCRINGQGFNFRGVGEYDKL